MDYRFFGPTGLQVSALSLGSWVNFGPQVDVPAAVELLAAARDRGINLLDNAQSYAKGESERVMGEALRRLKWRRESVLVTTKFFMGLDDTINHRRTLNRKYLLEAIEGSLARLGLDYVDIAYAHRPDPHTPIEETVRAFHDLITRGKALYWGTSEWPADAIARALDIAERHHLHRPVVEQPQYNLLNRDRVEREYAPLYDTAGLALTTWSPLAGGLLTGKYLDGVPAGSRADRGANERLVQRIADPLLSAAVRTLAEVAGDLGASAAQLALAWALRNPRVSTLLLGATTVAQLEHNLGALHVLAKLDGETALRLERAFDAAR